MRSGVFRLIALGTPLSVDESVQFREIGIGQFHSSITNIAARMHTSPKNMVHVRVGALVSLDVIQEVHQRDAVKSLIVV